MSKIAFLGLGAMGSRMAAHLVRAGHAVVVWNRDAAKAAPLRDAGAALSPSPRAAAADADLVISMVRDDDASRRVWLDAGEGALRALREGAVAIECSTLSLGWIRALHARFAAAGRALVDAPVVGSRPQADGRQLIFLAGGAEAVVARAEPALLAMGAAVHHVGPGGAGALAKLAVNALFGVQVSALAELSEMIRREGVDPARALAAIAATPACSAAAKGAGASMLADAFAPLFPVELAEKDFRYALAAAGDPGAAPVTAAAHRVFAQALGAGYGADNLTGIVRLYRRETALPA